MNKLKVEFENCFHDKRLSTFKKENGGLVV